MLCLSPPGAAQPGQSPAPPRSPAGTGGAQDPVGLDRPGHGHRGLSHPVTGCPTRSRAVPCSASPALTLGQGRSSVTLSGCPG